MTSGNKSRTRARMASVAKAYPLFVMLILAGVVATARIVDAASLTVQWTAPTTNADGSPLTDLSGYRIYLATSSPTCPGASFFTVASPTTTPTSGQTVSTGVTALTAGTTYFARVTAVDMAGNESACTAAASGPAQPDFTVTPTTATNFGSVATGSTVDRTFTVQNTSGASISGTASIAAPYSVVSGGSFSLSAGASQVVTIRFAPITAGTFAGNVNFTAGVDTLSRAVSGSATGGTTLTLSVTKSGTGSGTVTSSPAGINCGASCSQSFTPGTAVTLSAAPAAGSTFAGWSGACSGTGSCAVTINSATSITATFTATPVTLSVTKNGTGSGTVTSAPAGINCGATCSQSVTPGTAVTLTATPSAGSVFVGWGGACSGTSSCALTVNAAATATATFNVAPPNPPGDAGTPTVTQTAADASGVTFSVSWAAGSGATSYSYTAAFNDGTASQQGTVTATSAQLRMPYHPTGAATGGFVCVQSVNAAGPSANQSCSGLLVPAPPAAPVTLSVTKSGTGSGTVTGNPAGISCGATCSQSLTPGTAITLTATPAAGSTFAGWSGACSGTGTCAITINAATSVTATFTLAPVTLSVTKSGTGSGTVTSNPAGISCGATCSQSVTPGTATTLTATPAAGSTFAGWSGACSGTGSCAITVNAATSVTATFTLAPVTLSVTKSGTGSGTVTSNPAGISCGATCSQSVTPGTGVSLTATPAAGSTFAGWSGACSGTGSCAITVNAATSVTATFTLAPVTLSVTTSGAGSGTVTSNPAGISCGATCSQSVTPGTAITLTATPAAGSTFAGWSGACSGTGTCAVTVNAASSVTATFNANPTLMTLSVTKSGTGSGTVTSAPAGIDCGATCSQAVTPGAAITLAATPAVGSTFAGWSGACSGTGTCAVTVNTATAVTATFSANSNLMMLSITKDGTGSGTVTSVPAGINCGASCSQAMASGMALTLTAAPTSGSTFMGWSGVCSGTATCVVTLSSNVDVNATFDTDRVDRPLAPNPTPAISSLSPISVPAGSTGLTLTVNGTGFVPTSVVRWNGSNRTTTFVSRTQLQAAIAKADLTTARVVPITVVSPKPGGGTSAAVSFSVTMAAPPSAPSSPSVTQVGADASGVTFAVAWTPVNGVAWYRYLAAFSDGTAPQQGTVTAASMQLRMPYHVSGAAVSGFVCLVSVNAAGQQSATQSCNSLLVGARPTTPVSPAPTAPRPAGLVAAYSFDETSGPTVADVSGNNNTGTLGSNVTRTTQGRFGGALLFNGDSFVTVPNSASLALTTGMTLEAWVFPTASTGVEAALMKEQAGGLVYALYTSSSSGRPMVYFNTGPATNRHRYLSGAAALPLNTWSHLAATYDGATLRLYVNGAQVSSQPQTGSLITSTGALRIGGDAVWGEYFRGMIDEVRIYNRALAPAEIVTDMKTGAGQ